MDHLKAINQKARRIQAHAANGGMDTAGTLASEDPTATRAQDEVAGDLDVVALESRSSERSGPPR